MKTNGWTEEIKAIKATKLFSKIRLYRKIYNENVQIMEKLEFLNR